MEKQVKEFCETHRITEAQYYGHEAIEGSLDLDSVQSLPDGFSPIVCGWLDLSSVQSLPEGFNPVVGSSLFLRSVKSLPEGFNPTVGGNLYLRDGLKASREPLNNAIISWQNGKYIKADGIFTEVLDKIGNLYMVKEIGKDKIFYLATDGKSMHAHGDTIKEAKSDLRFKKMAEKLKNEPIYADTMVSVQLYRVITGACETGCRMWMEDNKIKVKQIRADKLVKLLEKTNAYGLDKFRSLLKF